MELDVLRSSAYDRTLRIVAAKLKASACSENQRGENIRPYPFAALQFSVVEVGYMLFRRVAAPLVPHGYASRLDGGNGGQTSLPCSPGQFGLRTRRGRLKQSDSISVTNLWLAG